MKVAIIGAGVAGLSCAWELERHGITPDIFERRYQLGTPVPFYAAMLDLGQIGIEKQLIHLKKHYRLNIEPSGQIKRLVIHGPRSKLTYSGRLGNIIELGQGPNSLAQQLAKKLQTKVMTKKHVDYFQIKKQYDWVVLADGSPSIPITLKIWQPTFQCWIRGSVIVGKFDTAKVDLWFDREFAREGFAMLIPINEKSATLLLAVNGISRQELHDYWNTFVNKLPAEPNGRGFYEMEYQTGKTTTNQYDNTLLIGNAGGLVDIFWGHGVFNSIVSGIEAARCLAKGKKFDKQIKPLLKDNERLYHLRQSLNRLNNQELDLLIKMLKLPGIKSLLSTANYSGFKLISNLLTRISGCNEES